MAHATGQPSHKPSLPSLMQYTTGGNEQMAGALSQGAIQVSKEISHQVESLFSSNQTPHHPFTTAHPHRRTRNGQRHSRRHRHSSAQTSDTSAAALVPVAHAPVPVPPLPFPLPPNSHTTITPVHDDLDNVNKPPVAAMSEEIRWLKQQLRSHIHTQLTLEDLQRENAQLRSLQTTLEQTQQQLAMEKERRERNKAHYESEINTLTSTLSKLRSESDELKRHLVASTEAASHSKHLNELIDQLKTERDAIRKERDDAHDQVASLTRSLQSSSEAVSSLQKQVGSLSAEVFQLESKVACQSTGILQTNASLDMMRRTVEQMRNAPADTNKTTIQQLERETKQDEKDNERASGNDVFERQEAEVHNLTNARVIELESSQQLLFHQLSLANNKAESYRNMFHRLLRRMKNDGMGGGDDGGGMGIIEHDSEDGYESARHIDLQSEAKRVLHEFETRNTKESAAVTAEPLPNDRPLSISNGNTAASNSDEFDPDLALSGTIPDATPTNSAPTEAMKHTPVRTSSCTSCGKFARLLSKVFSEHATTCSKMQDLQLQEKHLKQRLDQMERLAEDSRIDAQELPKTESVLQTKLQQLETSAIEQMKEVERLRTKHDASTQALESRTAEIRALEIERNRLQQELSSLHRQSSQEISQRDMSIKRFQQQATRLTTEVSSLQATIQELRATLTITSSREHDAEESAKDLRKRLRQTQEALDATKEKLERAEEKVEKMPTLEAHIQDIESQLTSTRSDLVKTREELITTQCSLDHLRQTHTNQTDLYNTLQETHQQLLEHHASQSVRLSELQASVSTATKENQGASAMQVRLQLDLDAARNRLGIQSRELDDLYSKHDALQDQLRQARRELLRSKEVASDAINSEKKLRAQFERERAMRKRFEGECVRLRATMAASPTPSTPLPSGPTSHASATASRAQSAHASIVTSGNIESVADDLTSPAPIPGSHSLDSPTDSSSSSPRHSRTDSDDVDAASRSTSSSPHQHQRPSALKHPQSFSGETSAAERKAEEERRHKRRLPKRAPTTAAASPTNAASPRPSASDGQQRRNETRRTVTTPPPDAKR